MLIIGKKPFHVLIIQCNWWWVIKSVLVMAVLCCIQHEANNSHSKASRNESSHANCSKLRLYPPEPGQVSKSLFLYHTCLKDISITQKGFGVDLNVEVADNYIQLQSKSGLGLACPLNQVLLYQWLICNWHQCISSLGVYRYLEAYGDIIYNTLSLYHIVWNAWQPSSTKLNCAQWKTIHVLSFWLSIKDTSTIKGTIYMLGHQGRWPA